MEQLGLVTICPFQPRARCWPGYQLQVVRIDLRHQQGHVALHAVVAWNWTPPRGRPARRRARFRWPQTRPWRRIAGAAALPGLHSSTVWSATACGVSPARCHFMASRYFLPAERSLAPSHATLNQGWPSRNLMKCCPTIPVAPRMPTSIRFCIYLPGPATPRASGPPCFDKSRLPVPIAPWGPAPPGYGPRGWSRVR